MDNEGDTFKFDGSKDIFRDGAWKLVESIIFSNSTQNTNDVILNTGATHHIFHEKSLFTSTSQITMSVQTVAGQLLPVVGVG